MKNNAIVRVLGEEQFRIEREKHLARGYTGPSADELLDLTMATCPLDEKVDEPLPQWAINVLRNSQLGFKWRLKIVFAHHFDLTGMNPMQYMLNAIEQGKGVDLPDNPILTDFRKKREKIAEEYNRKRGYTK